MATNANSGSTCRITRMRPVGLTTVRTLCRKNARRPLAIMNSVGVPRVLSFLTARDATKCIPNVGGLLRKNCALPSNSATLSTSRGVIGNGGTVATLTSFHQTGRRNSRTSVRVTHDTLGRCVPCFNCKCVRSGRSLMPRMNLLF